MRTQALALAVTAAFALSIPTMPAAASIETPEAQMAAATAAEQARAEMADRFGVSRLPAGKYLWAEDAPQDGPVRIVVSLNDQRAYVYRADELVAVSSISTGVAGRDTPTGIFPILEKRPIYHSKKYDNAPMPFMQRIDDYGIALHAGHVTGAPASHGCVRLPAKFAAKLYQVTTIGSTVMIGA